ncbi:MAG: hypothetical protein AB9835_01255 [Eubacteriales bacterium]
MKKRLLAAILYLCFILPMLFSCGSSVEQSSATTEQPTTSVQETTQSRIVPDLPEKDFDGYNFRILSKGQSNVHWKSRDLYAEEQTGEVINDAVYQRNAAVMDKYNFKITEVPAEDPLAAAKKSILAQSDEFDMLCGSIQMAASLSAEGFVYELNSVPYMDLSKPWYDQNANSQLSVMNKLFVTVGDMLVMDNDATLVVLFNKKLAKDLNLPNFYDAVNSGEWTIDMFHDSIKATAKDLNGDGLMGAEDQWGLESEAINTTALAHGAGARVVSKDENDLPILTINTDRFLNAFNKAMEFQADYNITMYVSKFEGKFADVWSECMDKTFYESRSLFNFAGLQRVTLFRSMETDFGILPIPKFDKEQKDYYSTVNAWCSNSISIPITVTDIERTGIIIEALSAESMYVLTPAYYDVAITTKSARDTESVAMLDIIFANRVFDLGQIYNWGDMQGLVDSLTNSGKTDIASGIEKRTATFDKALSKYIEVLEKLD